MRVAITGSSGLIGSAVTKHLRESGHEVLRLVRHEPRGGDERRIDATTRTIQEPGLADVDAVINFAGLGIADGRWSDDRKRRMRTSRVLTTETIVDALAEAPRCTVFLSGSAVGYYGNQGDTVLAEDSPHGLGYLAELCTTWERAAQKAPEHVRVVRLRTGHVLSRRGGILGKQRLVYQLGMGGRIGDGQQYVSWITIHDYARAVEFLLTHPVSGPVNMTAPHPVTNAEFSKAFARALNRPAKLPLPLPIARAAFTSDMVSEAMLSSQNAHPRALLEAGFMFRHNLVDEGMEAVT